MTATGTALPRSREITVIGRLILQFRVIGALMMREATAKYGHENLGFFWMMGEPLLLTSGVMLMWTISGAEKNSIGVVPMALSGYSMITLWRHIMGASTHALRRNAGLLFHRNVRPLDILISKGLLETLALMTAFFVAFIPLYLFGAVDPMRDPLAVIGAFLLQGWFAWSFALPTTAMTEIWEPGEKFVAPILYITLPFTGVFSMQTWMPQQYREILSWSPLVNTAEMLRSGFFPTRVPTYYDPMYVVIICLIQTAIGFFCIQRVQKHVTM